VPERSQVLARNLASLPEERGRKNRRARTFKSDRTLQMLVADLVAARTAAGMTQEEVAVRMWTTKSVEAVAFALDAREALAILQYQKERTR